MRPSPARLLAALLLGAAIVPTAAAAQAGTPPAPTPLAVDFKRAPLGSWAEYAIQVGGAGGETIRTRWAFLGRDAAGNTLELTMRGGATLGRLAEAAGGKASGAVVTRLVLVPDPVGASKPFRQVVMQLGDGEPIEVPLDLPGLPGHKFQNPDPKKLVARETIKVPAGSFDTGHYREEWEGSVVDAWVSDRVPPLGLIRTQVTPTPGTPGPGGKPMPPVTMELVSHGKDARPAITRPPRKLAEPLPGAR